MWWSFMKIGLKLWPVGDKQTDKRTQMQYLSLGEGNHGGKREGFSNRRFHPFDNFRSEKK